MGWIRRAPAPPAASKRDRTEHETQPRRQSCHAACGQRTFVVGNDPAHANLIKLIGNMLTATALEMPGEAVAPICTLPSILPSHRA